MLLHNSLLRIITLSILILLIHNYYTLLHVLLLHIITIHYYILLHHYYIIIRSLLHHYYIIVASLLHNLHSLFLHHYYNIIAYYYIFYYYILLQNYYYVLSHFYYTVITLLSHHYYFIITQRKSCNNDCIITCYAKRSLYIFTILLRIITSLLHQVLFLLIITYFSLPNLQMCTKTLGTTGYLPRISCAIPVYFPIYKTYTTISQGVVPDEVLAL